MTTHPVILKVGILLGLILVNYNTIATTNCNLTRFDTIIVLGTPSLLNGTPSPEQRERVLEGIREYRAGIAPHIIMTGAAAHNKFVEAHSMKLFAISQGVPASVILEEDQAHDTIQNIYFSHIIMQKHHWNSAEVVSSPSHLPRTALILKQYHFQWRTHPAHWPPEYTKAHIAKLYWGEMRSCWILTHHGFRQNKWLPLI